MVRNIFEQLNTCNLITQCKIMVMFIHNLACNQQIVLMMTNNTQKGKTTAMCIPNLACNQHIDVLMIKLNVKYTETFF